MILKLGQDPESLPRRPPAPGVATDLCLCVRWDGAGGRARKAREKGKKEETLRKWADEEKGWEAKRQGIGC